MKEADYIAATNSARVQAAKRLMMDVIGQTQAQKAILPDIQRKIAVLEQLCFDAVAGSQGGES